jgi:hypothetical protein
LACAERELYLVLLNAAKNDRNDGIEFATMRDLTPKISAIPKLFILLFSRITTHAAQPASGKWRAMRLRYYMAAIPNNEWTRKTPIWHQN